MSGAQSHHALGTPQDPRRAGPHRPEVLREAPAEGRRSVDGEGVRPGPDSYPGLVSSSLLLSFPHRP